MSDLNDSQLLFRRIAEGDKKAFSIFFDCYYPKLVRFAATFVNSTSQAEDIVSDVLTTLLIQRKRIFILDNVEAYLFSSVKNKALTHVKKQQRVYNFSAELSQSAFLGSTSPDPHTLLMEQELATLIREVISGFPPKRIIMTKFQSLLYCMSFLLITFAAYDVYSQSSPLLALWTFNNTSGDASGNGNNVTLKNGASYSMLRWKVHS